MSTEVVVGFGGGEVSPNVESRIDLDLYKASCSTLENMNPLPEGGAQRRAGSEYINDAYDPDVASYLKEFSFSDGFSYILEFSDLFLRIWRVQDATVVTTLASPWTAEEARDVQYDRENDVAWFWHPDHPEYVLSRTGVSAFTLEETSYDYPALLEKNNAGIIMSISARTGTGVTLTSDQNYFTAEDVGNQIALNQPRLATVPVGSVEFGPSIGTAGGGETAGQSNSTNSLWCAHSGYNLTTGGTGWRGRVWVEESVDGGTTWEEILFIANTENGGEANFRLTEDALRPANSQIRLAWDLALGGLTWSISAQGSYNYGLVTITARTSDTEVTVDIDSDLYDTSDISDWYEGAFCEKNGYPRCGVVHDGARWVSGNKVEPYMVWRSRVDNYYNFRIGTYADEGLRRRPKARGTSMYMTSKDSLILGTSKETITIVPKTSTEAIGPENIDFVVNTGDGSAYMQAELANDAILFVQKGAKKVRDMIYSDEARSYVTNDVSALAKHITKKGIVETALSLLPEQRLYTITEDGQLGLLSYERSEAIVAWSRYESDGLFKSVAVADNGEEDAIWYTVYRNGQYRIERQKSNELDGFWYLDSAVELGDSTSGSTVTNLSIAIGAGPDFRLTVTSTAHGFLDGRKLRLSNAVGFDYLEGLVITVADKTANTFVLKDADGVEYLNAYAFSADPITATEAGSYLANDVYEKISTVEFAAEVLPDPTEVNWIIDDTTKFIPTGLGANINSHNSQPTEFTMGVDGLNAWLVGQSPARRITHFTLSEAFNISTMVASGNNLDLSAEFGTGNCTGVWFTPDGLKLWAIRNATSERIYEYTLTTAWDLSTATYSQFASISEVTQNPSGIWVDSAGEYLYTAGNGEIHQYTMSTAYDLSTLTYVESADLFSVIGSNSINSVGMNEQGTQFCVCKETNPGTLYYIDLTTPHDLSTWADTGETYDLTPFGTDYSWTSMSMHPFGFTTYVLNHEDTYITQIYTGNGFGLPEPGQHKIEYETDHWECKFYPKSGGEIMLYDHPDDTPIPLTTGWSAVNGLAPPIELSYINDVNPPITADYTPVYNQVTGLDHLEGKEVTAILDQSFLEVHTVSGGLIDLDRNDAGHVVAGCRYALLLSPLPIEALSTALTLGHEKILSQISLKLKDSYGGEIGTDLNNMESITRREIDTPLGEIPELFTGNFFVNPMDSWEEIKRLYIRHDLPYPFEILSLSLEINSQGRG